MFPLYQTSGFYAAPVSKALVGSSILACIGFNLPLAHLRNWFRLTPSTLSEDIDLLSGSLESLFLAIIGLLSGVLVRKNIFWVQNWLRIPKFVAGAFHKTLGWLLYSPPPPEPSTPMGATLEIQRQQQIERLEQQMAWGHLQPRHQGGLIYNLFGINRNGHRGDINHLNMANMSPPSDEQIQRLVEMGFNRDNVMNALRASNNDINAATSILLHDT
ncbi:hypothetical protein LSH36_271g00012 [Paralvinella palmiformis]|uniref:UBA domain-containing protein n=1 Tax=Paralvinella palmiformis TaxID=53620 RepID=A0AAD9JKT1_9ANNE|nr:hypothetical protein LSH36_271g00012 [Paralvinella palmiformis]